MIANSSVVAADLQNGACLAEIIDNDGAGSGLDADLLDGQHAAAFGDATLANQNDILARIGTTADAAALNTTLFAALKLIAATPHGCYRQTCDVHNAASCVRPPAAPASCRKGQSAARESADYGPRRIRRPFIL